MRIEASDDKESDSNLAVVGGSGVVHSGAVAGFPIPPLRYYVGNSRSDIITEKEGRLALLLPAENAKLAAQAPIDFSWVEVKQGALYRLEAKNSQGQLVLSAFVQSGTTSYRAPNWLQDKLPDGELRWRIVALNFSGRVVQKSDWRSFKIATTAK